MNLPREGLAGVHPILADANGGKRRECKALYWKQVMGTRAKVPVEEPKTTLTIRIPVEKRGGYLRSLSSGRLKSAGLRGKVGRAGN